MLILLNANKNFKMKLYLFFLIVVLIACNTSEKKQPLNSTTIVENQNDTFYLSLRQLIQIFSMHKKSKESIQKIIGMNSSTTKYLSLSDERIVCLINNRDSLACHNSNKWDNMIYYTFHDKILYESLITQIDNDSFNKVIDEIDKESTSGEEHVLGYTKKKIFIILQDKYLMDDTILGYRIIVRDNPYY